MTEIINLDRIKKAREEIHYRLKFRAALIARLEHLLEDGNVAGALRLIDWAKGKDKGLRDASETQVASAAPDA